MPGSIARLLDANEPNGPIALDEDDQEQREGEPGCRARRAGGGGPSGHSRDSDDTSDGGADEENIGSPSGGQHMSARDSLE